MESIIETTGEFGTNTPATFSTEEKAALFRLLSKSRSKNTNLAYSGQLYRFEAWLWERGERVTVPISGQLCALYLAHLNSEGKKISTLTQAVAALDALNADNGHGRGLFHHHLVNKALDGARREMVDDGRSTVNKALCLSVDDIEAMVNATAGDDALSVRNRAILTLGFSSGMRASNLLTLSPYDVVIDGLGMTITLRRSKTDQYGRGSSFYIERLSPSRAHMDAVASMEAWIETRKTLIADSSIDGDVGLPLFLGMRKGGVLHLDKFDQPHGINRVTLASMMAGVANDAGLSSKISTHSMRTSFVTAAFDAGVEGSTISKTTGHKSMGVLNGYNQAGIRSSSITRKIFE